MNTDEIKITVQELEVLCRLYMDCKLSVLEEKELEYILSRTDLTSPLIEEVRAVMSVNLTSAVSAIKNKKQIFNWRMITRVAASVAVGVCLLNLFSSTEDGDPLFVEAYSHGHKLNASEAIAATSIAMAKADSLMYCSAMAEEAYLLQAEKILSLTPHN